MVNWYDLFIRWHRERIPWTIISHDFFTHSSIDFTLLRVLGPSYNYLGTVIVHDGVDSPN